VQVHVVPAPKGDSSLAPDDLSELQAEAKKDVILRVEQLSGTEARVLQYSVWVLMFVLGLFAIGMIVAAFKESPSDSLAFKRGWYVWQLIAGSLMLGVLLIMAIVLARRVYQAKQAGKRWCRRRQFLVMDAVVVLIAVVRATVFVGK